MRGARYCLGHTSEVIVCRACGRQHIASAPDELSDGNFAAGVHESIRIVENRRCSLGT